MKYKNLIFDLDGTLWDSRASIIENWNEVLFRFNLIQNPMTIDDMVPYMGFLPRNILRVLFPEISDEKIDQILIGISKNENAVIKKHGGKLYENVEKTLYELNENHDLYIVSNCQDGYIESFIEFFEFKHLFKDFLSHGKTGFTKELNLRKLIKRNHLNVNDSVYIGDTSIDLEAAKFNDLEFIFCNYGFGKIENVSVKIEKIDSFKELIQKV